MLEVPSNLMAPTTIFTKCNTSNILITRDHPWNFLNPEISNVNQVLSDGRSFLNPYITPSILDYSDTYQNGASTLG